MAVNVLAPTGLSWSRNLVGAAPTGQANAYLIKKGYATAIGFGDIVQTGTGGNQGYVTIAPANPTAMLGVFAGVLPYFDITAQATSHGGLMGSWPTTANPLADVPCLVFSSFTDVFHVQASGTWNPNMRGLNVNWLTGTNGVPGTNGISTLAVDLTTAATTNTLPLRIVGLAGVAGGPQDPNNTNPQIEVSFNLSLLEMLQGTGV